MANYLIPAAGRPTSSKGSSASEIPGLAHSEHYRIKLYRRGNNPLSIEGNLYENFAINTSADWSGPLSFANDIVGNSAGAIGTALGGSIGNQAARTAVDATGVGKNISASAKTWAGGSELSFDLPLRINAIDSTSSELMEPLKAILKSSLPTVKGLGVLAPPGPTASRMSDILTPKIGAYTNEEWSNALKSMFENQAFHLRIGSFFHMFPSIVESVSANISSTFEHDTGNPMSIDFNLSIKSYLTPTSQDVDNWIITK